MVYEINEISSNPEVLSAPAAGPKNQKSKKSIFQKNINQKIVERNDATKVAKPNIPLVSSNTSDNFNSYFNLKSGKTAYKEEFKDYQPVNRNKYNKVYNQVVSNMKSHGADSDPQKAKAVANMVCALSDKYGVDPEITVTILGKESGGYQFTDEVMVNPGSIHKGVMQVDKDTVRSIYADRDNANNKSLSLKSRKLAYDHIHFEADDKRINQLKKLYPTADKLYAAMQKDVALGVEIGLMAYKSKLSVTKGDTIAALKKYCGNQYRLPSDSTAVKRIWPLPQYR